MLEAEYYPGAPTLVELFLRHCISTNSLLASLGIERLETYYHHRLLRWAGRISSIRLSRWLRMLLTGLVANPRPLGCHQMTWGRMLENTALSGNGLPTDFGAWHQLAADRSAWRQVCGGSAGPPPPPPRTGK